MAETAPVLRFEKQTPEIIDRRTDDILFDVHHLARHIVDREQGIFAPEAERDVLEQDITDVAEADIHKLGAIVHQHWDAVLGQYVSLGTGTVDNAYKGWSALDPNDEAGKFEWFRRAEEIIGEETILLPVVQQEMRAGKIKIEISSSPTHHEAEPEVAKSFGYDDRTMFRMQALSPDGQMKSMQSFSVFDIPARAWASFLGDRYAASIEPTALAVMEFCNKVLLESGTPGEILTEFIGGVSKYVDSESQVSIERQLDAFLNEQADLEQQAVYYAREKLELQKELALSLNTWARPKVARMIGDAFEFLNEKDKMLLGERMYDQGLYVDDYVAGLAVRIKTLTLDNRAGLATLNERTVKRVASRIGLEATLELVVLEQTIQRQVAGLNEFMIRRSEQRIAESGVGCGGGCSVSILDLFSSDAKIAREAGLSGTLYTSSELDKSSKCSCAKAHKKAKVIADGSSVVCVTCGEFKVKNKKGSLKITQLVAA